VSRGGLERRCGFKGRGGVERRSRVERMDRGGAG
jgi:hypothetical protein